MVLLMIFAVFSVVGAILERPVFLSYITSNSMQPTLNKNDLILLNPFARNYNIGDIIVFHNGEKWICHRIFAKTQDGFLTKGDNNIVTDQLEGVPPVKPEKIAGKVVTINEKPLKIPGVGDKIEQISNVLIENKYFTLIFFLIVGLKDVFAIKRRRKARFVKISYQQLYTLASVFVLITFSITLSTMISEVDIEYGMTLAGSAKPGWVYPDETFLRDVEIRNPTVFPLIYAVVDKSDRAEVKDVFVLLPGEKKIVFVKINAPEETSIFYERIYVAKILPVFPLFAIKALVDLNVYLILIAEIALLAILLYIGYKLTEVKERYRIRVPQVIQL